MSLVKETLVKNKIQRVFDFTMCVSADIRHKAAQQPSSSAYYTIISNHPSNQGFFVPTTLIDTDYPACASIACVIQHADLLGSFINIFWVEHIYYVSFLFTPMSFNEELFEFTSDFEERPDFFEISKLIRNTQIGEGPFGANALDVELKDFKPIELRSHANIDIVIGKFTYGHDLFGHEHALIPRSRYGIKGLVINHKQFNKDWRFLNLTISNESLNTITITETFFQLVVPQTLQTLFNDFKHITIKKDNRKIKDITVYD